MREGDLSRPGLRRIEAAGERRIREAIGAGEFTDLPGEGARLPSDDDDLAGDRWAAHRVLRNSGALPAWAELGREIAGERERLVRRIVAHRVWMTERDDRLRTLPAERLVEEARRTARADTRFGGELENAVAELNALIDRFNAIVPLSRLQVGRVSARRLRGLATPD